MKRGEGSMQVSMQQAAAQEEWELEGQPQEGAEDQVAAEGQEQAQEIEPTPYDALASEMGWKPKSEWKGQQDGWVPAEEYIRTTFQKQREGADRLRDMRQRYQGAQRSADEYAMRLERLERATNSMMAEQEARMRSEMRQAFEYAKREAIQKNDDGKYQDLLRQEAEAEQALQKRFEQQKPPELPDVNRMAQEMLQDPIVGRFWREHPWVAEDEDAYAYAYAVAQDAADAGHPKTMQIRMVKEALRDAYPDQFARNANAASGAASAQERVRDPETGRYAPTRDAPIYQQPQRRQPPAYNSGGVRSSNLNPEQKARATLPPEAVRVFEEQKAAGRFKGDIVKFAKIYNQQGPMNVLE